MSIKAEFIFDSERRGEIIPLISFVSFDEVMDLEIFDMLLGAVPQEVR